MYMSIPLFSNEKKFLFFFCDCSCLFSDKNVYSLMSHPVYHQRCAIANILEKLKPKPSISQCSESCSWATSAVSTNILNIKSLQHMKHQALYKSQHDFMSQPKLVGNYSFVFFGIYRDQNLKTTHFQNLSDTCIYNIQVL